MSYNSMSLVRQVSFAIWLLCCLSCSAGCGLLVEPTGETRLSGDTEAETGQGLFQERRFEEAIVHLKRALEQPRRIHSKSLVLTTIGNCYDGLDRFDEALEYHEKAIKEDPKNYKAYVNKGIVLRMLGEKDAATSCYQKALELAPDYAELHASLGAMSISEGDYVKAIEHLERAVKLDDSLAVGHSNLAAAYASAGRFDDADRERQSAIAHGYHNVEALSEYIEAAKAKRAEGGNMPVHVRE